MSTTEKKLDAVEKRTHLRPAADRRDVGRTVARVAAAGGPWDRAFAVHVLVVTRDVD